MVMHSLLTFVIVFLINWFWTEQSFILKPLVIGVVCGGIFYSIEKIFKKKNTSKEKKRTV
ncbi:hypothetical protein ABE65_012500 [Fictibacillus phosphorivorans]|uniref:Uncharacterized protein n=1 Tax=Fictibacillus phosphorivorans TaxID=1221500 RepID=A0A160IPH7_9BACL|nr:hypothetical protein ABE65_012500 [Fictibacillus phosphorivorans]